MEAQDEPGVILGYLQIHSLGQAAKESQALPLHRLHCTLVSEMNKLFFKKRKNIYRNTKVSSMQSLKSIPLYQRRDYRENMVIALN